MRTSTLQLIMKELHPEWGTVLVELPTYRKLTLVNSHLQYSATSDNTNIMDFVLFESSACRVQKLKLWDINISGIIS